MTFVFQSPTSIALLVCAIAQLSSPQENNVPMLCRHIGSIATVVCTGCDNEGSCIVNVNNVTLDEDYYVISQNGSVAVSVKDVQVYGIVDCGGSIEQLMSSSLICPPRNGTYDDWLTILSSNITITVGQSVNILATFSHLPHSGITIEVNGSVSGDKDLSCATNTPVRRKTVNYTCMARRPGVKEVKVQLTFCDIDFSASILITIKDLLPAPVNQSTSTSIPMTDGTSSSVMMSSNMTTSSNVLTTMSSASDSAFSAATQAMTSSPSSTSTPTNSIITMEDDDSLSEGAIAAIAVSAVILSILILLTPCIVICIWFRSTGNPCVNNITFQRINYNVHNTNTGSVPTGNGNVDTGNGDVSAGNGPTGNDGNVDNLPSEDYHHPHEVEDGGDELSSDLNVHKPETETRNNVVEGVEVTESIEHSSSGQNNGECEVETTEFIERNSSGQNQQRAAIRINSGLPCYNVATVYK